MSKIPAGTYRAHGVAGSVQEGLTSNGTEQIAVQLFLDDLGETVTAFLFFSEKAMTYSFDKLKALGWEGDTTTYAGIDSKEAEVSISYEEYEGKERMRVDIRTGGGGVKLDRPMQGQQQQAFRAKLAALAKASGGAPANGKGREGFRLP